MVAQYNSTFRKEHGGHSIQFIFMTSDECKNIYGINEQRLKQISREVIFE